jgi:hypothetical protein
MVQDDDGAKTNTPMLSRPRVTVVVRGFSKKACNRPFVITAAN